MSSLEQEALAALAANDRALGQAHNVIQVQERLIKLLLSKLGDVELPPELAEMAAHYRERVH
jgi:hypothetical protein